MYHGSLKSQSKEFVEFSEILWIFSVKSTPALGGGGGGGGGCGINTNMYH